MMLNAVTPQRHHQQTGAGNPLTLDATSSSSVATISTSPTSSTSSSSASSSSTTTSHNNHDQQQLHNLSNDHDKHSQTSKFTNVTSSTATTTATTATTTMTKTKTNSDTKTTETTTTTTTATPSSSETQATNKLPVTQTKTTSHHQPIHNQNHYQHNSYQSPRYNHHSHHDLHHNYNMSYAARSSNNNQRGHNTNHTHHSHHNHNQNHSHHHHHQHQQQQQHHHQPQQQPIDNSNIAVSSSTSTQTTETTIAAIATSNQAQRQQSTTGPPYYVDLHVNVGECVSLQLLDGQEQVVAGPATMTMISQQQNPPVPIPVQVPPGHMIHQIADENGTLKHIILSVMDTEDGSQLDSTVITLPKGTFRIDSHGELVSTNGSDGVSPTTLPQQAYFANYDGCPVAYDATTLPDSIETATPATTTIGQTVVVPDIIYPNNQPGATTESATKIITNDESEQEQNIENNPVAEYDQSSNIELPSVVDRETNQQPTIELKGEDQTKHDKQIVSGDLAGTEFLNNHELANKTDVVAAVVPEIDHQMIVQGSISDTTYAAHQPLGTEMNLMNGPMAPMLPAVDGQLYGYPPPCCCCCYCDPQEAASGDQQAPLTVAGQQEAIIVPEHATSGPGSIGSRVTNRSSATTGLTHQNGVLGYPSPMMAPIQSNMAMPLGATPSSGATVLGQPVVAPLVGQNSAQASHMTDSTSNQKPHGHPTKGGRGSGAGYKHHKIASSNAASNSQPGDRHQSYAGGHYNQSYNSIVSGHHHQQHYQPTEIIGSSASFKSQTLMPNQGPMLAGSYSPIYSSYDPVPTTTMANVVSASNKPAHGNQGNHHHNNYNHHHHHHNNNNHHQQQQSMGSNFRINNNSDSDDFVQRTREQVSYNHTNSYGLQATGGRQQHNNNDNNKRQTLSDKSPNQQHNSSNRYTAATIKVISNNHLISNNLQSGGGNNSTQAGGSVSPIRSRIKGNPSGGAGHHHNNHHHQHNHHNHHQSNGLRNSGHYNGAGPMQQQQQQQIHETRENNMHLPAANANSSSFHSSASSSSRDPSNLKSSKTNVHSYDHNAPISKHINVASTGGGGNYLLNNNSSSNNSHKQQVPAWQQHNKFNISVSKNNTTPAPLVTAATNSSDLNDLSGGDNNSTKNQSPFNETGSDIGRRTKASDSSGELLRLSKAEPLTSMSQHDLVQQQNLVDKIGEQKNEDSNPRTSRGKQKKCQNQQIKIQQSERQLLDRHNNGSNSNKLPMNVNNETLSYKLVKGLNEFSSLAAATGGPEIDVKISIANDKTRMRPTTTSPIAPRSDSKSGQTTRGTAARSPLKQQQQQQQQGQKNQGQKRAIRDKSSAQLNRTAVADKGGDSSRVSDTKSRAEAVPLEPVIKVKAAMLDSQDGESNIGKIKQYSTETQQEINNINDEIITMTSLASTSKATSDKQPNELPKLPKLAEQIADGFQQTKHKNKHNNNNINNNNHHQSSQYGEPLSESPARKQESKKVAASASEKHSSPPRASKLDLGPASAAATDELSSKDLESRINSELVMNDDMLLLVSESDSPTKISPALELKTNHNHAASAISITMRTSLSENNIQSLETTNSSSIKSTQTTPQKLAPTANPLDGEHADDNANGDKSASSTTTCGQPVLNKKKGTSAGGDKRRASTTKLEQLAKLSSMPQLRLLNFNCTSVTSSSVQLRWSYIPSLAEKYGIHNHHSGAFKNPALMDHFVVEFSSCKNAETNTLVSPKIVYQGCALTCRVNQLLSERIYHFKVRRTALLTTSTTGNISKTDGASSSSSGEHLVVSEILSVTLPGVQQQSSSSSSQQQQQGSSGHTNKKNANGPGVRSSARETTSSLDNSGNQALFGDTAMVTSTSTSGTHRGNTSSSHNNHSNSSSSSSSNNNRHQVKFANLFKQCRTKFVTVLGKVVRNSLSSYSDTKFAGLLLVLFTIFAMLLAIFIHYYIVTPVTG